MSASRTFFQVSASSGPNYRPTGNTPNALRAREHASGAKALLLGNLAAWLKAMPLRNSFLFQGNVPSLTGLDPLSSCNRRCHAGIFCPLGTLMHGAFFLRKHSFGPSGLKPPLICDSLWHG